jgi:antibiotic biosynthesis monooxygenase (ABM) superfamily enzyme
MNERHVTFKVHPDKKAEFEKMFVEEYRPAMASMPGFKRVDLLCRADEPLQYEMAIRFDSAETSAAWRSSTQHEMLKPKLKALYSDSRLQVFDVIA